ncbi:hypothetical protein [Streptomyces sp. NPDC007205]|uniref:fascin domain-containing protein n=1 Tax=Streptomyces sp. NPDC007205 TaxID=3154316 RepID=UPI0033F02A59
MSGTTSTGGVTPQYQVPAGTEAWLVEMPTKQSLTGHYTFNPGGFAAWNYNGILTYRVPATQSSNWTASDSSKGDEPAVCNLDSAFYNPGSGGSQLGAIQSAGNGRGVMAQTDYTGAYQGMLRADGVGEGFTLTHESDGSVALKNQSNNMYVSAELEYIGGDYGMLRARASSVGPWEKFDVVGQSDGSVALMSKANHEYVSAELADTGSHYGMLRARASSIGPWEKFR